MVTKSSLPTRVMEWTGLTRLIESMPARAGILALNYHRVGDPAKTCFDRGVFSATSEELDSLVRFLKPRYPIIGGEELEELAYARKPLCHLHIALTFDDGYRDNYTHAFDILRSHGVPGHFFLVSDYVGTATIPWWDAIAFYIRHTPHIRLALSLPDPVIVFLTGDREEAIQTVLRCYKQSVNGDGEALLADIKRQAEVELPSAGARFLSWKEAAEMRSSGMTIGSHTVTHRILARLSETEQERELRGSRERMEQHLGAGITSLAYPIGSTISFTAATERIARQAGYRVCMSYYGGLNTPDTLRPDNVLRTSIGREPLVFRAQVALLSRLGQLPFRTKCEESPQKTKAGAGASMKPAAAVLHPTSDR